MQQSSGLFLSWLKENLSRLFTKSPKFFRIWQIIMGGLVLISSLPDFFGEIEYPVPHWVEIAVKWASRGFLLASMLTTQSTPVAVTDAGDVVKKTDEKKLPFTSTVEQISAEKKDLPTASLN